MNEEILQNLNRRLDEALDKGRKIVDEEDLEKRMEELKGRAEILIREHPLKSVAVGLLTGYIIGKIFSSSED